jgi:putative membrane protein insertion efficiency factor
MTAKFLIALIRGYQLTLSPFLGGACRFEPSCSAYAREAIECHGAGRGSWLALRRLSRCHPFGGAGLDPVPHAPRAPR